MQSQKRQNDLGLFPRQTIQHHSKTSLCLNHWCWRSWSWQGLWRPARPTRPNTKKKKKKRKRYPEVPRIVGKFGLRVQNEAGQRLTEFCQEMVIANTLFQQHKRHLYTWTSSDGQYGNQIDYVLCSQRWISSIQSAKIRPGADCGLDHEFLIAKFRLKLKKVEKTTKPFRYDLNQIPYDYSVEVMNRFKGLDLTDSMPEELWMEVHNIV